MWCRSAVNLSFFLSFAVNRMRSSPWVTLARLGVRCVSCRFAFPLVPALRPSDKGISGLNHTPHAAAVYASRPPLLAVSRNTRFQAARYALPGLDFHQLIAPASWRSFAYPTTGYAIGRAPGSTENPSRAGLSR